MKKKFFIFSIIILLFLNGCQVKDQVDELDKKVSTNENLDDKPLNNRQKNILVENELSTDIDDLTYGQRESIFNIEEMLKGLEFKYGKTFVYEGYVQGSVVEEEYLLASDPDLAKSRRNYIKVYRRRGENSSDVFNDNYVSIALRPLYEEKLYEVLPTMLDDKSFKVFADITYTSLDKPVDNIDKVLGEFKAWHGIFIEGEDIGPEKFESYGEKIKDWLQENTLGGECRFIKVTSEDLANINSENYDDYFIGNEEIQFYIR